MEVLIIKSELEEKFHLNELLKDHFKVKIIEKSSIPADIILAKSNKQFLYLNEGLDESLSTSYKSKNVLLQMTNPNIINVSMKSIDLDFKMILFRDRFDLAELLINQNRAKMHKTADPAELISFMTWERAHLDLNDCKEVLKHFKSLENMFNLSKDALEFSLKSLNISERSKQGILTFLTTENDLYID